MPIQKKSLPIWLGLAKRKSIPNNWCFVNDRMYGHVTLLIFLDPEGGILETSTSSKFPSIEFLNCTQ